MEALQGIKEINEMLQMMFLGGCIIVMTAICPERSAPHVFYLCMCPSIFAHSLSESYALMLMPYALCVQPIQADPGPLRI